MTKRLEAFLQDRLLTLATVLGPVVAVLSLIFGMFVDLAMIGLLSVIVGLAAWVEKRQRARERDAKGA